MLFIQGARGNLVITPPASSNGRRARGFTLIEITIALAIAGMMVAIAIASVNSLTDASLKSAAVELTGAIKTSYDRAIMEKRVQRLSLDLDKNLFWLEYTVDPYALDRKRQTGKEGAKREDEDEETDDRDRDRTGGRFSFEEEEEREVEKAMEGGKGTLFAPDEEFGQPRRLPGGIQFSKVWTGHQEESFTSGIAVIHFFRSGFTEAAQIEIRDEDDFMTLKVSPLTGRVRTYSKQLDDPDKNRNNDEEDDR